MTKPSQDPAASPVILFDGSCAFCERSMVFVARREREARFLFGASQTVEGQALLAPHGLTGEATRSIILLEKGQVYMRSTAALRIARQLRWPWPLAYAFVVVPRPVRDAVYMLVSRHRHRLAGHTVCEIPPPEIRGRIVTS